MTESDWLACDEPHAMLESLQDKANDRKLRLFTVACCRRIVHLLEDQRSRAAVEVIERFADGLGGGEELRTAAMRSGEAVEAAHWENRPGPIQTAAEAVSLATSEIISPESMTRLVEALAEAVGDEATDAAWEATWTTPGRTNEEQWALEQAIYKAAEAGERHDQADLLRCIFGNPFRRTSFDPARLSTDVVALARTIYEGRAFDRLPELAEALEASGPSDAEVLGHCRRPGMHFRGCWVVDAILDKR